MSATDSSAFLGTSWYLNFYFYLSNYLTFMKYILLNKIQRIKNEDVAGKILTLCAIFYALLMIYGGKHLGLFCYLNVHFYLSNYSIVACIS